MSILTEQEAVYALNFETSTEMPGKVTSILLPAVDAFIQNATGKDWGTLTDSYKAIDPLAKQAATLLLVRWFEDSSEEGKGNGVGVISLIGQLQAKYLLESQATT